LPSRRFMCTVFQLPAAALPVRLLERVPLWKRRCRGQLPVRLLERVPSPDDCLTSALAAWTAPSVSSKAKPGGSSLRFASLRLSAPTETLHRSLRVSRRKRSLGCAPPPVAALRGCASFFSQCIPHKCSTKTFSSGSDELDVAPPPQRRTSLTRLVAGDIVGRGGVEAGGGPGGIPG
jgi:hypothetical protein